MIMNNCMLPDILQRLREVNTLLATYKQGELSFEQALPPSLFYQDFNDTNILVKEAACLVRENPGELLEFSSSLFSETDKYLSLDRTPLQKVQPFSKNTSNLLNSGTRKRKPSPPDSGASIRP